MDDVTMVTTSIDPTPSLTSPPPPVSEPASSSSPAPSPPVLPAATSSPSDRDPSARDLARQAKFDAHLSLVRHRLSTISANRPARLSSLLIRAGDVVIVYSSPTTMSPLRITPGAIFSNRYGHFYHDDFINAPYASKVRSRPTAHTQGVGYVTPLPVTPELWTLSLTHRTQILYFADIALILLQLNVLPGSIVVESGTGSGSLTVSLSRTVAPTGHVHTFEFNSERVKRAKADFDFLSLTPFITVHHRDVVRDGFPLVQPWVDAVFLDLPSPWDVVDSCGRVLRHLGRLASFSPCIEQVQRVVMKLDEGGWGEVRTMEVLLREYEVSEQRIEKMGHKTKAHQDRRKRDKANKRKGEDPSDAPVKRAKEEAAGAMEESKGEVGEGEVKGVEVKEEVKAQDGKVGEDAEGKKGAETAGDDAVWEKRRLLRAALAGAGSHAGAVVGEQEVRYPLAMKSFSLARGHTGYLTFATRYKFADT